MTHGRPWVQGCPWEVSKEPNDTRHLGYQFSKFSTLKTNTGSTHHGVTHGRPWVQGCSWEVSKELIDTNKISYIIFFGRFLASISAQVRRNITKITRNVDFKKTDPPATNPFTRPPGPPGSQKIFWEISDIYFSSSLKKYHQNYKECRF